MSFTGYNPYKGMEIYLEWLTDDKGYVKKVYRVYLNGHLVEYNGKTDFRDDNEAIQSFKKLYKIRT